jgi:hypothetical protein
MPSKLNFVDWDWRPAVFFDDEEDGAFAILKRNGRWEKVDWRDVYYSGLMSEKDWRAKFEADFGRLDLSKLPLPKRNEK